MQGEKTRAEIAREHDIAKSLLYKVKENVGSGLVAGFEDEIVDVFHFQCAKEAFGRGIVVAVANATHTGNEVIIL